MDSAFYAREGTQNTEISVILAQDLDFSSQDLWILRSLSLNTVIRAMHDMVYITISVSRPRVCTRLDIMVVNVSTTEMARGRVEVSIARAALSQ